MTDHHRKLEDALRSTLRREAPPSAPVELYGKVMSSVAKAPHRRRWRLWRSLQPGPARLFAAVGAAGMTVVVSVLMIGLLLQDPPGPAIEPAPTTTATSQPSPSPAVAGAPTAYPASALIPGASNFPVMTEGSVWAPRIGQGDLVRFDIASSQIVARIAVSRDLMERGPQAIAVRGDEVWVNAQDDQGWALLRIDAQSNEVARRIPVNVPGWALSIVGDTAWMTSFERNLLLRINLASGEVEAEIDMPASPLGVAAADDGVWVAMGGWGRVVRVDPTTNETQETQTLTRTTTMPLLIGDEVWVTTLYSQQIVILSRETNEVIDRIELQSPMGIAHGGGELVWVTDGFPEEGSPRQGDRVVAIDIATRNVVRELPMTGLGVDRGITVDGDTLWVATADGIARLDVGR